jgi:chromosome partitioning protein
MQILTVVSLSGGQGKTTTSFFLGLTLASLGFKTLWVDGDPQHNLSLYGRSPHQNDEPTLLECITGQVQPTDAIYPTDWENLSIMPSDRALEQSQTHLANVTMGELLLKKRLKNLDFDYCIIDSPPQRSQLCVTCICAADKLIIPAEANSKGLACLQSTLETIDELSENMAFQGEIIAIVPFRDTIRGLNRTKTSREAIAYFEQLCQERDIAVTPSIVDSEKYKQAIDRAEYLPTELNSPFNKLIELAGVV